MKNIKHLQIQLKSQLLKSNLTIREVERRAGLNRSALGNILQGKSKNPTLHTLYAIAEALGCSLSDLIESPESEEGISTQAPSKVKVVFPTLVPLLHEIIDVVATDFRNIDYDPNLEQFWLCVRKVYIHAFEEKSHNVDHKYAEWLVDKFKE